MGKYNSYQIKNGKVYKYVDDVEDIKFPESVTGVEEFAFADLTNLKNIEFTGESLVLYKNAFSKCNKLEFVQMPKNTQIDKKAFDDCSLKFVYIDMHNGRMTAVNEENAKFMDRDADGFHKFSIEEMIKSSEAHNKGKGLTR